MKIHPDEAGGGKSPAAGGPMKLGRHHFAFFRGCVEGVDPARLGELYLETGSDARAAKAAMARIRTALAAACRRAGRHGLARLASTDPGALAPSASPGRPDLEEFRAVKDPSGFYSEAELIGLWEEEGEEGDPGTMRREARKSRLRARLRRLVIDLEDSICQSPVPGDPLSCWLDPGLCARLSEGGIGTIGAVLDAMARRKRWWARAPGIGKMKADRIAQWIRSSMEGAALPSPAPSGAMAPLDSFSVPAHLDGSAGSNRGARCLISGVGDDAGAIRAWLAARAPSPETRRAYRKEAERFLLWMLFERGKPLSSADEDDLGMYRDFLARMGDPCALWFGKIPREDWIAPSSERRGSPGWRPFSGKFSRRSARQACLVLDGMFAWMASVGYLDRNPWKGLARMFMVPKVRADRALSSGQWELCWNALGLIEDPASRSRMACALSLAFTTGMRRFELALARAGHLRDGREGMFLAIEGKGSREREVPLAPQVMAIIKSEMAARGFGAEPGLWPPDAPLLRRLDSKAGEPLTPGHLYRVLGGHFALAASCASSGEDAARLLDASAHWLRHTCGSSLAAAGENIAVIKDILGHASLETTTMYVSPERRAKAAATRKLAGLGGIGEPS